MFFWKLWELCSDLNCRLFRSGNKLKQKQTPPLPKTSHPTHSFNIWENWTSQLLNNLSYVYYLKDENLKGTSWGRAGEWLRTITAVQNRLFWTCYQAIFLLLNFSIVLHNNFKCLWDTVECAIFAAGESPSSKYQPFSGWTTLILLGWGDTYVFYVKEH